MATTLIKAAKGKLDLKVASTWDKTKILPFFDEVAKDTAGHGVPEHSVAQVKDVVALIKTLSAVEGGLDESIAPVTATFDIANYKLFTLFDAIGWMLSIVATAPAAGTAEVTDTNYFIPLITLYASFCLELLKDKNKAFLPAMLHIAYWQETSPKEFWCLLGSTPGKETGPSTVPETPEDQRDEAEKKRDAEKDKAKAKATEEKLKVKAPTARSKLVIKDRQTRLLKMGFEAVGLSPLDKDLLPDLEKAQKAQKLTGTQDKLIDVDTASEGNIGFGRCAESFFYIWAGCWMIDNSGAISGEVKPHVRGLALKPKSLKGYGTTYNQAQSVKALADPCEPSCQNIMLRQMKSLWKWEPEFMLVTPVRGVGQGVTL